MEIKFTQELKDAWLTALRSGKYEQTKETLRDNNGFCCLGVLCDILDPGGWNELGVDEKEKHKYAPNVYGKEFCQEYEEDANRWNDVQDLLPIAYFKLSSRNDGDDEYEPHNFSEMADYIEENVQADG